MPQLCQRLNIFIVDCTVEDAGEYQVTAFNKFGKKSAPVKIIIYDKPGPPKGPVRFEKVTADSVTLSWDPPSLSGGCQISNYIVEKREAASTVSWQLLNLF